MAWRGSISRSLAATARSSALRSPSATAALPRLRTPSIGAPRLQRRLLSFASPRLGELGCVQSLLPIHTSAVAPRLTSHLSGEMEKMVDARDTTAIVGGNPPSKSDALEESRIDQVVVKTIR